MNLAVTRNIRINKPKMYIYANFDPIKMKIPSKIDPFFPAQFWPTFYYIFSSI